MATDLRLVTRIRDHVAGEMHLGHLRPGDRLPSVRDLASELGVDHRAVGAVFRALEQEGVVQVRGRAGAFLAQQERLGGGLVEETATWLAGVLAEARRRRVWISEFPDFVRSCTGRVRLRCACIESNSDSSTAICIELNDEFGLEVVSVSADSLDPQKIARQGTRPEELPGELLKTDLWVTTAFHAPALRAAAEALRKPFALVTVHPEMAGIIERRVRSNGLTVIVADAAYGERFRTVFGDGRPDTIRVVLAEDRQAIARLDRAEPVLATRAVRLMLPDLDLPLLLPRYPSISPDSTRDRRDPDPAQYAGVSRGKSRSPPALGEVKRANPGGAPIPSGGFGAFSAQGSRRAAVSRSTRSASSPSSTAPAASVRGVPGSWMSGVPGLASPASSGSVSRSGTIAGFSSSPASAFSTRL